MKGSEESRRGRERNKNNEKIKQDGGGKARMGDS